MSNNSKEQLNSIFFEKYNDTFSMSEREYRAYIRQALRFMAQVGNRYPKDFENAPLEVQVSTFIRHLVEEESKLRTISAWRKLRGSLSVLFEVLGRRDFSARIRATKNPIPPCDRPRKTGRDKRLTTVTPEDFETMCTYLTKKRHFFAHSLCIIARSLGLRPCEIPNITFTISDSEIRIKVPPHKNTKKGKADPRFQRGIERELVVERSNILEAALIDCQFYRLTSKDVRSAQEQIRKASLALWPRRMARFCLYSLRYTLGSHLKAAYAGDPKGAIKIAAALGHKATSSARSYGNIRSSGGGFGIPIATAETCSRVVDDCKSRRQRFVKKRIASPSVSTPLAHSPSP